MCGKYADQHPLILLKITLTVHHYYTPGAVQPSPTQANEYIPCSHEYIKNMKDCSHQHADKLPEEAYMGLLLCG